MGSDEPKKSTSQADSKFQFYNSESGEVLGRTWDSWGKIALFYVVYFTFLAGLFIASLRIGGSMIDQEKPNVQTRLNIPGVNVFPKIDYYNGEHNARIKENENIPFFWDSSDQQSYSFYEQLITAEKNKYDDLASLAGNNVIPVEWSQLGECGIAPFAWDTSEPCVFLRLNRVIDWMPVGLHAPVEGTFFAEAGNGPTQNMQADAVYMRCKDIGKRKDDSPDLLTFDYINDGYLDQKYFPFDGKMLQPGYQSPIVAVKIKGIENEKKYRIRCHAHAKNIIVDDKDNLGSITFEVQHGGKAIKS